MEKSRKKIKRIDPIIRVKKSEVERESALLNAIRTKRTEVNTELMENQSKYIANLEKLNQARSSSDRSGLSMMESGLDFLKHEWAELFKMVKVLDNKEQSQLHQLNIAMMELKSVEKLSEKYTGEFKKAFNKKEQLDSDEASIYRTVRTR